MSANNNPSVEGVSGLLSELENRATLSQKEETEAVTDKIAGLINQHYAAAPVTTTQDYQLWNKLFQWASERRLFSGIAKRLDDSAFFKAGEMVGNGNTDYSEQRIFIFHYLNLFRQSSFLVKIYGQSKWEDLINQLIKKSDYTIAAMFLQRAEELDSKKLFRVLRGKEEYSYTWSQIKILVDAHAKALLSLIDKRGEKNAKIAFLMENSLDMAVLDLACLTTGIVNIMIPANAVPQHVEFILNETETAYLIVSDDRQFTKVKQVKNKLTGLRKVIVMDGNRVEKWVVSLGDLLREGEGVADEHLNRLRHAIRIPDLATIMYTSGTTGEPKGIMFSQMNLIFKRFCRAMALPEIGESDRFQCYLPLFHTFGRYLEMLGSVFWGAEYIFMENPAKSTMLDTMQRVKPSVFISIPKKWKELYEHISEHVNVMVDEESDIRRIVEKATGGQLRWGLSAAGYLEPDIFRFFQKYGVELMSGFGMTEATGGITMTPPGKYVPNSLGRPLPGVYARLGDDGEMLIRGDYIMMGYFGIPNETTFDADGWLPTGDIMRQDANGFYEIIDRKKEIYKNLRGETIAPQKIENLFRDFEIIAQVFLVGDQRLFNTVLIYPDQEKYSQMNDDQREAYFSSVIVTINKFLAPFERIVDYKVTERPFSAEKGELTPKGTYKRKAIEKNFKESIQQMYTRNFTSLKWDGAEIRIPNWFLREMGLLKQDIKIEEDTVLIPKINSRLQFSKFGESEALYQIGDYVYHIPSSVIDLRILLSNPNYWLGNEGIYQFSDGNILNWYRLAAPMKEITFYRAEPSAVNDEAFQKFKKIQSADEISLPGIHLAIRLIQSCDEAHAREGIGYLQKIVGNDQHPLHEITVKMISQPQLVCTLDIRRETFLLALPKFRGDKIKSYLKSFLDVHPDLLSEEVCLKMVAILKGSDSAESIRQILEEKVKELTTDQDITHTEIPSLLNLLALFGIRHPTMYKLMRQYLVEYQLSSQWPLLTEMARSSRRKMLDGFRRWLGDNQTVAVDVETGEEYEWSDVMTFETDVDQKERQKIIEVITKTSIIREAVFLFTGGVIIRLYDIPQGGVWISKLGELKDKSIYRTSIQTRFQGAYDLLLVLDYEEDQDAARSEVNWIIHSSASRFGITLVDEFGGYWPDFHVWSEAFVPGEPVSKILQRSARQLNEEKKNRLFHLWRFIIWTATFTHVQFWHRSRQTCELADKSIGNIIVPEHDYQTGERFVSIAQRKTSTGLLGLIKDLYEQLVIEGESAYPFIKNGSNWSYIFSGVVDALGEKEGLQQLESVLEQRPSSKESQPEDKLWSELDEFLSNVREKGFMPRQLFFAVKRFHRWKQLNQNAALTAQALTLSEFYDTYQLNELEKRFPETRTRFYLETVFREASAELQSALLDVLKRQHGGQYLAKETLAVLASIQKELTLSEEETYFLTRLSYPHLKPTDTAYFVEEADEASAAPDVVVRLEDYDGKVFWIRHPLSSKEISRLHQLFLDNNLPVNFRPDDHFLVAVSERGYIIGGLFYNYTEAATVHMDKIVVANRFRKKGVSEGLMTEFFNRMRDEHIDFVTTGFLRPEYFYRFGFKIERKYAGLVKDLRNETKGQFNG